MSRTRINTLSDRERYDARLDKIRDKLRRVLDENESLALDNDDDKEALVEALLYVVGPK